MSITVSLEELLDYSDFERNKWEAWFSLDASRMQLPLQGGGRFPTAAALLDHIFLVERRHLARLEGSTPPDSTGVPPGDVASLFEYARLVRADFREYVICTDDAAASDPMTVKIPAGDYVMSRRQLAVHVILHEIRHLAQLALAARLGGQAPPGEHDIFYMNRTPAL
jgi:uncharacterized damage-inducible protein DinB